MHDLEHFSCRSWTAVALDLGFSLPSLLWYIEIDLFLLTFSSFLLQRCWFHRLNSIGLTLPTVPILGAAPAVSPITPLVPALAGLGGSGLQVPIATLPTVDTIGVPRECLLLKDMFDPNDEVGGACFLKVIFLSCSCC